MAHNIRWTSLLLRALVEDETPRDSREPEALLAEGILDETLAGIRRLLREGIASGAFREVSDAHTVQTLIGASVYHFASGELGEACSDSRCSRPPRWPRASGSCASSCSAGS